MRTLSVQALRFVVVGVVSNALLYMFYLYLAWVGLKSSTAMTVVFVLGALQTFFFNKHWTFSHSRSGLHYLVKYALAYTAAYLINLWLLYILVDKLHYPHQMVQGFAILLIGVLAFFIQRYWVFAISKK